MSFSYRTVLYIPESGKYWRIPVAALVQTNAGVVPVHAAVLPDVQCLGGKLSRVHLLGTLRERLAKASNIDSLVGLTGPRFILSDLRQIPNGVVPEKWVVEHALPTSTNRSNHAVSLESP